MIFHDHPELIQDRLNRRTFLGGAGAGVLALAGLLDTLPAAAAVAARARCR